MPFPQWQPLILRFVGPCWPNDRMQVFGFMASSLGPGPVRLVSITVYCLVALSLIHIRAPRLIVGCILSPSSGEIPRHTAWAALFLLGFFFAQAEATLVPDTWCWSGRGLSAKSQCSQTREINPNRLRLLGEKHRFPVECNMF